MWGALIRSTLTYSLQTQELKPPQKRKIYSLENMHMRKIIETTGYAKINTTNKKRKKKTYNAHTVHIRTQQPTITSWLGKQRIIEMARQTDRPRQENTSQNPAKNETTRTKID